MRLGCSRDAAMSRGKTPLIHRRKNTFLMRGCFIIRILFTEISGFQGVIVNTRDGGRPLVRGDSDCGSLFVLGGRFFRCQRPDCRMVQGNRSPHAKPTVTPDYPQVTLKLLSDYSQVTLLSNALVWHLLDAEAPVARFLTRSS